VSDNIVQDIFGAHEGTVKLLHTFHIVVILETYKTNRYKLPLLEMVGVTLIDITYSISLAYMESERSDNYVWALSCLKHLIVSENGPPKVFISDRDVAFMNALNEVFPQ
jgi:histone-lysine N-methyltransferase SETD2